MLKKKISKVKKRTRKTSRKRNVSVGALVGILLVVFFLLYLGINSIKRNSVTSFDQCVATGQPVMESYPRQCSVGGKTFVEKIKSSSIEILQLEKNADRINLDFERGNYVINSIEEWVRVFGETEIDLEVSLNDKTIIVAVMGSKPTGGYSVSLKQLEVGGESINFFMEEVVPGVNCIVTQALSNPYQILAIDKTNKTISFTGSTVITECE